MKYFVTSATGFIGERVARQLVAVGGMRSSHWHTPAASQALVELGIKVYAGDITDKESLRTSMMGVDGVFHIAAWYKIGVRNTSQAEPINVGGMLMALRMNIS